MSVSAIGAILALVIAIILILKKVPPTYAMIIGAIIGGLVGGVGLFNTVTYMIDGTKNIVSAVIRIVVAGVLAGTLIESGAAARIAESIVERLGSKNAILAMILATWALTAVGVFGDVAIITVSPIAIQIAQKVGYRKLGILIAMIGGVKAGNVMSPNPNTIAAAETFKVPLTSMIAAGIPAAAAAIVITLIIAKRLSHHGTEVVAEHIVSRDEDLPGLVASLSGPAATILLLLGRPLFNVTIDPLIALPVGGLVGMIVMGKVKHIIHYLEFGLEKMSGVAMLLIGTGTLAGIIANSTLKVVIIDGLNSVGLPAFLLAPISGILMGAASASSTAGTTLASQVFGGTILSYGVGSLAAGAMVHSGSFVFDGLPHGSFFHVSAGTVNMQIKERLKLIPYEAFIGFCMVTTSTILYGVIKILG
ncbi:GntP family gluconate:H+ symporter [Halanaerobium saccharolyticum]|uniref:GntP family gluconate:H+ symporter n=1 Tax=Halanaerobium saccharolyticum TaxID=43595 RepID=A0A4R7YV32_9FIRM|nr:GntP family permease [Halanaerobium saccharolyticum]RAK06955.1 GntP family gluconate:H+ symporter [Halanaerobium saccharolyticum]TDW01682.1 GntP family gluconate:H+ symporter [Halanaerobium saccharolyticum]TDX53080.1 GntP family gluconate:H+ symporter [Halanaerobium saccharolyticum]